QDVILPNVPKNTTDLSAFQAVGQPLASMILPKSVEYRLVGQNQEQWNTVQNVDKVIDTDTGTGEEDVAVASDNQAIVSWEWRGGIIYISPAAQPVDIRVRFQGIAIQLNSDNVQQVAGM